MFFAVTGRAKSDEVLWVLVLSCMVTVMDYQIASALADVSVPMVFGFALTEGLGEALVVLVGMLTHRS